MVSKLNYIELAVAWSLAVGFGLAVAVILGDPAYLNPGVVFGQMIFNGLPIGDGMLYIPAEFLAAGVAVLICMIFFWDSFKATEDGDKRGIFSAYPVSKNMPLNFVQEILATFMFLFLVLGTITAPGTGALQIGVVGFAGVLILSLTLNSTGFSMNAMRSFFSSIWFAVLPIPNKGSKVDWAYQLIVNLIGSSIGGILAVLTVKYLFA